MKTNGILTLSPFRGKVKLKKSVHRVVDQHGAVIGGVSAYNVYDLNGEKIWIDMSKFKHRDIIESAANLDKLRSIGFNFDEIRSTVGWEELNTDFSRERVITKNYTNDLGGEGSGTQNTDT